MRLTRTAARAGVAVAVAFGTLLTAVPASADIGPYNRGTVGERETVCAEVLTLRRTAPHGAWDGDLVRGQTFLVESGSGEWIYGFAYGDINRRGYVQNGWFC
jgi:hypothetical protein